MKTIKKLYPLIAILVIGYFSCKTKSESNLLIELKKEKDKNNLILVNNSTIKLKIENYNVSCDCINFTIDTSNFISSGDTLKVPFEILKDTIEEKRKIIFTFKTNLKNSIYSKEFQF